MKKEKKKRKDLKRNYFLILNHNGYSPMVVYESF